MRNIILIGFMGSGKTTIAIELSHRLNMRYISTDDLIEKREKRTINGIFTKKGEDYFRSVESEAVRDACSMENVIIDMGGGAVMRDENWEMMKASGIVISLLAHEDIIMERTKKYKHRPLLNVKDPKGKIKSLMHKREPFYARAEHRIDTGVLTVKQAVDRIVQIIGSSSSKVQR